MTLRCGQGFPRRHTQPFGSISCPGDLERKDFAISGRLPQIQRAETLRPDP